MSVLIVSPTRELASQIHVEANQLLTFHEYGAQVVFGGTNIGTDKKRLREKRCDFLVATLGRLIDHLENEGLRGTDVEFTSVGFRRGRSIVRDGF